MTTDLAKIKASNRGLQLSNLQDMRDTAQLILQSGFAPDGYIKPEQIFVALQSGAELGLPPIHALNSIAVIKGKPSLYGDAALALVKGSGLLYEYKEEVVNEGEFMVAKVHSVRKEGEIKTTVDTEFSVDDARQAKLWMKPGVWQTHPKRMLKYKARAFNLRDNFPDVLMGLHITEELVGETLEPLPAPDCDTPKRENRKPAQDITITDTPKPVTDSKTLLAMLKGCKRDFNIVINRDVKPAKLASLFNQFATYILQCNLDDIKKQSDYTFDMLTKLNKALEQPLPKAIIDLLPKDKDK